MPRDGTPLPRNDSFRYYCLYTAKSHNFKFLNSACNANEYSFYHDLKCGHRIQVKHASSCGTNCEKAVDNYPFVCATCVADEVRTQMIFACISLDKEDDDMDDGSQEGMAHKIVKDKLFKLMYPKEMKDRHRPCKVTKNFDDPKLQYFNDWMEVDGLGGIDEEEKKKSAQQLRPTQNLHEIRASGQVPQPEEASAQQPTKEETPREEPNVLYKTGDNPEDEDPNKLWCHCRKPDSGTLMVEGCNPTCEIKWYHVRCLGPFEAPKCDWWCPTCKKDDPTEAILEALGGAKTKDDVQVEARNGVADHTSGVQVGEETEDMVMKAVVEHLDSMTLAQEQ